MTPLRLAAILIVVLVGCVTIDATDRCEMLRPKIAALIDELANPNPPLPEQRPGARQARIFRELEDFGIDAVPGIVRYMDSRLPIQYRAIELKNPPGSAIESVRQYDPELVVDAMAALLNQLTGRHFGSIETSIVRTDALRDKAVSGWRRYVETQFRKDFPTACKGSLQ